MKRYIMSAAERARARADAPASRPSSWRRLSPFAINLHRRTQGEKFRETRPGLARHNGNRNLVIRRANRIKAHCSLQSGRAKRVTRAHETLMDYSARRRR